MEASPKWKKPKRIVLKKKKSNDNDVCLSIEYLLDNRLVIFNERYLVIMI